MKSFLNKYFSHILFICISLILTVIWFHNGFILALGESGIPFYDLSKLFTIYGHTWAPLALGFFPGTGLEAYTFFGLGLPLQYLHFPGFLIQAIFFFAITLFMFEGSYLFFPTLIKIEDRYKTVFAVLTALFYVFNLIALVSVWNRMQYPFILFYALLPFCFWLFSKAILNKNIKLLIILNLVLIPFAMAFAVIPFFILTWLLLAVYVIFLSIVNVKKRDIIVTSIVFFGLAIVIWLLFNAWWFIQFLQWAFLTSHGAYTLRGNVQTLDILSDTQENISYIFRLMNKVFFTQISSVWGGVYFSAPFTIISFFVPFLAFFPLLLKKRPVFLYFFLGLALLTIFFTKGSAQPFGEFFLFLFSHFHALESFRSAFEKFGLVLPLAYAPLIAYSIVTLLQYIRKQFDEGKAKITFFSLVIILFIVLVFPFWNGWIFTYPVKYANNLSTGDQVNIPDYYKAADTYLNSDKTVDFRTYLMPSENDGVTYTWPRSFTGVDYTNGIFNTPFLSMNFIENLGFIMNQLQYSFDEFPNYFSTLLALTNTKYVMVRNDIDFSYRDMRDPKKIISYLSQNSIQDIAFVKQFGKLFLYKNVNFLPKIYPVHTIFTAAKDINMSSILDLTGFTKGDAIINTGEDSKKDAFISPQSASDISQPTFIIDSSDYPANDLATAEKQLPQFTRFLPGNKFYPLLRLKEKLINDLTIDPEDKLFIYIDLSAKRLAELQAVSLSGDRKNSKIAAQNYLESIQVLLPYTQKNLRPLYVKNIDYIRYRMISEGIIVSNLAATVGDPELRSLLHETQHKFGVLLSDLDITSLYPSELPSDSRKMAYRFSVEEDGEYSFVLQNDLMKDFYSLDSQNWEIQVDKTLLDVVPTDKNSFLDFGTYTLTKGNHEIQVSVPAPLNLLSTAPDREKIIAKGPITKTFSLDVFNRYATYKMTFDYNLNKSYGARVEANSDIDYKDTNGQSSTISYVGLGATMKNEWRPQEFLFTPQNGASTESISFVVHPSNICQLVNMNDEINQGRCTSDSSYNAQFNYPTIFEYKNIKLERIFNNPVFLVRNQAQPSVASLPEVTYTKINPASYVAHVKNAKHPFFLVFSEDFDTKWKATYQDSRSVITIPETQHYLADSYANMWYITKTGTYDIHLGFTSERLVTIGGFISGITLILSLIVLCFWKQKKRKK